MNDWWNLWLIQCFAFPVHHTLVFFLQYKSPVVCLEQCRLLKFSLCKLKANLLTPSHCSSRKEDQSRRKARCNCKLQLVATVQGGAVCVWREPRGATNFIHSKLNVEVSGEKSRGASEMLCKCRGRTEEEGWFLFPSRLKGEAPRSELWIPLDTLLRVRSAERSSRGRKREAEMLVFAGPIHTETS